MMARVETLGLSSEVSNVLMTVEIEKKDVDRENPFDVLPDEMIAEIFFYLDPICRQQLRTVSRLWKFVVDHYHGIHLEITNMNWNSMEECCYVKSITLSGFTRDVMNPVVITSRLVSLELTDMVAYYSFLPLLEHCHVLESLIIDCVTFLNKSRLPEYGVQSYIERSGKSRWLPRLKHFKFVSCTTQRGVYNQIIPNEYPEDFFNLEDPSRAFDISRGEMEFVPFILQILVQSKSLIRVEMVLTDIWKIPFADLLQVSVDTPPPQSLDVSLWHFGSKRLLPIGQLLLKVPTVRTLRFMFPHHYDTFFMELAPRNLKPGPDLVDARPYQLDEVMVQQSLRWSQEMREVDTLWLQILEHQFRLKKLEYPFPIFGADQRMAKIIEQNCKTLKGISFMGHRENREDIDGVGREGHIDYRTSRLQPWDSEWFTNCEVLEELCLKSHTRFLAPTSISSLTKPNLLPATLKQFHFHGCIELGKSSLGVAFCSLVNLELFVHQARICPWYVMDGVPVSELLVSHVKEVLMAMPKLKKWKLEWCDTASAMMAHFVINSQLRHSAYVSKHVFDWLGEMRGCVECKEITLDRQMKAMSLKIISHHKIAQH